MHRCWLPSILVRLSLAARFAGAAEVNFVDASEAIFDGCLFLVAFIGAAAVLTGVVWIFGKAMRPTVIQRAVV
jgi:hypothetical protein